MLASPKPRLLPVKIFSCWSVHCCSFVLESEFQTFGEIKKSQTVQAILSCRYGGFNMLLCTIVENGANTRFCRESGECRDYALFLSFFYSEIYSEKSNFGRILAEILPKKLAAGGSDLNPKLH